MGEEWGQAREFITGASTVINTIAFDPELKEHFQRAYGKQMVGGGEGNGKQSGQGKEATALDNSSEGKDGELTRTVRDVAVSEREGKVKEFETKYGIDRLSPEEQKEARRKIESHFNQWGQSVKTAPLSVLSDQLNSAFLATHAEKLREEGKLEGLTRARENDLGTMGSFSGGTIDSGQNKELSPKQKEWAKKLGVDEEKATKRYVAENEEK